MRGIKSDCNLSAIVHITPQSEYKETRTSNSDIPSPQCHGSTPLLCPTIFDFTNQSQRIKHSPLKILLIKPGFLLQNHLQYSLKRIRTEGGLPTSRRKRLERRFPKRKAPTSLI